MRHPQILELPVRCRVVRVRRLTPLHWALLRALQVFPAGNRLPLSDFSARLGLPDSRSAAPQTGFNKSNPLTAQDGPPASIVRFLPPGSRASLVASASSGPDSGAESPAAHAASNLSHLGSAWGDLLKHHAVDSARFEEAGLTLEGQDALRLGYVPIAPPEDQERFLHFDHSGHPIPFRPQPSAQATPHRIPSSDKGNPLPPLSPGIATTQPPLSPGQATDQRHHSATRATTQLPPATAQPTTQPTLAATQANAQQSLPPWAANLTPERLSAHLRSPACSAPLAETEELQSAHPLWPEARLLPALATTALPNPSLSRNT